ncbi:hypothetical protein ACIBKY_50685 [Nonomuraea sp. NPDC050394]|uniref:hypothetical protein n=1 Tax=Nonomuraea sp. NPDC050394 TaxID=3364363 RepID=UPI0037A99721
MHTVTIDLASDGGSLSFHEPSNTVWFATSAGEVRAVRLMDRREWLCGSGFDDPVEAVPVQDGLAVAVVERDGRVCVARREAADALDAATVADLGEPVVAARLHPDFGVLLVLTGDGLYSVDLTGGVVRAVATDLSEGLGLAVDDARREAFVLRAKPDGTQGVSVVALDSGDVQDLPQSVSGAVCLVTAPLGDHGVLVVDGAGSAAVHRADGTSGPGVSLGHVVSGMARWGTLLLALEGGRLHATEWDLDPGPMPVTVPLGPLFVRGYADVPFDPAAVGLAVVDVEFEVAEGPECGTFSAGIEPGGAAVTVLLAARRQGEFHLLARERGTGTVLATRRFRVTACWPDAEVGPPVAVSGEGAIRPLWGGVGGVASYTRGKKPAPKEFRLAVVLVSTKDRRFGTTLASTQSTWKDYVIGSGTSARTYLEEVSYFNQPGAGPGTTGTTVRLLGGRVLGPVDLDHGWGDLFKMRNAGNLDGGWTSLSGGPITMVEAISSYLLHQPDGYEIMRDADALVIVVRSGSDMPVSVGTGKVPTKFVWGHARRRGTMFSLKAPIFPPAPLIDKPGPIVVMTDLYPAVTGKKAERTLCHELGHALDLDDLYDGNGTFTDEVKQHLATWVDLMHTSDTLPHLSIANRLRLGWVRPAWLRRFDFSLNPNGAVVTLRAAEALSRTGPPPGQAAGIEVPINDSRSYLFEYRRQQPGMVGDQELNEVTSGANPRFVLGTDVDGSGKSSRPPILLLPDDSDGEGPILDAGGEDYEDNDTTHPARMFDFRVTVESIGTPDPDTVTVKVDYIGTHRPQLVVRPAPGGDDFKSPDIELINPLGVSPTSGFFIDSVIKGAPNVVRITIHNVGTLDAKDVLLHVKWIPYTTSAGGWQTLPDPPRLPLVPAKGKTSLTVVWNVPASLQIKGVEVEHFCFRVDIDRYWDPVHPEDGELVVHDNWAQSNFATTSVGSGSPSQRIRTVLGVANELPVALTHLLEGQQSRDLFRIYLGNAWLWLDAGESRYVDLAYESLAGDPILGGNFAEAAASLIQDPNQAVISLWRVPPPEADCATPAQAFGANLQLHAGQRCWFEGVRREGEVIWAQLLTTEESEVVPVTHGIVYLSTWSPAMPDMLPEVTTGEVEESGVVRVRLGKQALALISQGGPLTGLLGRPEDSYFARAVSPPTPLA